MEDALELLRVASNLGFSEGVDAALLYIQSVPWTADEKASVAQCISLPQVQVSEEMKLRLRTDGPQSVRLCRMAVRDGLVQSWKRRLLEWRNALETYCRKERELWPRGTSTYKRCERVAYTVLSKTISDICKTARDSRTVISHEAVLLVLLRTMLALSEGEVLCQEELKEKMVCKCVTAFTGSSPHAQQHFCPEILLAYTYQGLRASTRSMWPIWKPTSGRMRLEKATSSETW